MLRQTWREGEVVEGGWWVQDQKVRGGTTTGMENSERVIRKEVEVINA